MQQSSRAILAAIFLVISCAPEKKEATPPPAPAPAPKPAAKVLVPPDGKKVMEEQGCTACHSIDGSAQIGPTFKGLFGSKRVLADGKTVIADEDYIRESIEKPEAKLVKGFEPNMPQMPITPEEEKAIVDFIKTLK